MNKRGVSITILVITIIIMIIISGVAIVNLSKNNSIDKANEVVFKQDIKEYSKALELEMDSRMMEDEYFDPYLINENTYAEVKKYIQKFQKKYEKVIVIKNGEISYIGTDAEEIKWMKEIGINVG